MDGIILASPDAPGKQQGPYAFRCICFLVTIFFLALSVSSLTSLIAYQLALQQFTAAQNEIDEGVTKNLPFNLSSYEEVLNYLKANECNCRNFTNHASATEYDEEIADLKKRLKRAELMIDEKLDKEQITQRVEKIEDLVQSANGIFGEANNQFTGDEVSQLKALPSTVTLIHAATNELNQSRVFSLYTSKILSPVAIDRISSYFKEKDLVPQRFSLLYRGSEKGFSAPSFHRSCDNKGSTLVVIKSVPDEDNPSGQVFGAFTTAQWRNKDLQIQGSPNDFLFSLQWDAAFSIKPNNIGNAISTDSHIGPTFGMNPEIKIGHECHKEENRLSSLSILGSKSGTYALPTAAKDAKSFIKGQSNNFVCEEYEVYSVQFYGEL